MNTLLKLIPLKLVIALAWKIIKPILEKKVIDSASSIDNIVLKEISELIEELTK